MRYVRDSLRTIHEKKEEWPSQTAWYIFESLDAALEELD